MLTVDFNDADIKSPFFPLSRGHSEPIVCSLHLIPVAVELVGKMKSKSLDFSATFMCIENNTISTIIFKFRV